jgi:hypothetical protein
LHSIDIKAGFLKIFTRIQNLYGADRTLYTTYIRFRLKP